jgi:hypothetical protein
MGNASETATERRLSKLVTARYRPMLLNNSMFERRGIAASVPWKEDW